MIKCSHCNLKALALLAQNVLCWNFHILKSQTSGIRASLTHVHKLAGYSDSRGISIYDETGNTLMSCSWISLCQNKVKGITNSTVGDPHLFSINNVLVSLLHRLCLNTSHIGSSPWLGNTVSSLSRTVHQHSQVLFLLLFITSYNHR